MKARSGCGRDIVIFFVTPSVVLVQGITTSSTVMILLISSQESVQVSEIMLYSNRMCVCVPIGCRTNIEIRWIKILRIRLKYALCPQLIKSLFEIFNDKASKLVISCSQVKLYIYIYIVYTNIFVYIRKDW